MISCIVLSAGESRRFGSPKALANIHQKTVIEYVCEKLKQSQVAEIIIVLGAHKALIEPHLLKHTDIRVVYNNRYKFGQTSSFKAGLKMANLEATGYMLFPIDCPFINLSTLDRMIGDFSRQPDKTLLPSYLQRKGHPPIFPAHLYDDILNLPNDVGINALIRKHQEQCRVIEYEDPGIVQTFNTPEELEELKQII